MRVGIVSVVLSLVVTACGNGPEDGLAKHGGAGGESTPPSTADKPGATPGAPNADPNAPPPAPAACPATPAAKMLVNDGNAADVQIASGMIYFRTDSIVSRIAKDGTGRTAVYTNPDLVRTFVDTDSMLHVESPNTPDAVLLRTTLTGQTIFAITPGFIAASTHVFGVDNDSFYLQAEISGGGGDAIYKLGKLTGALTQIAGFGDDDLSDAQLAYPNVWFVRSGKRAYEVKQVAQVDGNGDVVGLTALPATEIFASGSDTCKLAVGAFAYCSNGKTITKRDLDGANPTVVFDEAKSPVAAPFGSPFVAEDVIAVRPDATAKTVIRLLTPSTSKESIIACGRDGIGDVAVDKSSVAWAESGANKGLYLAPR